MYVRRTGLWRERESPGARGRLTALWLKKSEEEDKPKHLIFAGCTNGPASAEESISKTVHYAALEGGLSSVLTFARTHLLFPEE